jgi:transcriptional regulator GlxA family with amidase domain
VAVPALLAAADPAIAAFERYIREHLDGPIQIDAAARAIGVSERTLQRATQSALGMAPIRFVQEARLEQATFLLRTTNQTPAAIALAVGYQDVSTLRTLIRRRRHTTLAALRGI